MFLCPNCESRLSRSVGEQGVIWTCPSCRGHAVGLALLRRLVERHEINCLWQAARHNKTPGLRCCPACENPMVEISARPEPGSFKLDVCVPCEFFWFDTHEFESMPVAEPELSEDEAKSARPLPQAAREAIALAEMERIREQTQGEEFGSEPPDEWWKFIPGLLGLPIEYENNGLHQLPWATWGLAALTILISLFAFQDLREAVNSFGFISNDMWRLGGLTMVSSFFLHVSILHLLGNMYFLLVFGDNVEDYLGRHRFLWLILCSALVGDLFHAIADPHGQIPCVGASGGIAGIIVFYALEFPHARLGFLMWWHWLKMPAYFALILFLIYQAVMASWQVMGASQVSALAHLGGATTGFLCWAWLRYRPAKAPPVRKGAQLREIR